MSSHRKRETLVLEDRLYSQTHQWVKKVGEKKYRIGITEYAQSELRNVIGVELPKVGTTVEQFQPWGYIESNKTAVEIYSPIAGKVVATNENNLGDVYEVEDSDPQRTSYNGDLFNINKTPYETWLIEVETEDEAQLQKLLKPEDYNKE